MVEEKGGGKKRIAELELGWLLAAPRNLRGAVLGGAYEIRPSGCQRLGQLAAVSHYILWRTICTEISVTD